MLFYLIKTISSQLEPLNTFLGESFESIHSLSIAVFCCLITLYFTVLGIVLGRNKISFVQFWKFSITKSFVTASVLLITSVFFLFFPNIITLKIFNLNIASLVCIVFLLSLIVFSVEAIKSTEYILNKDKGYKRAKYLLDKGKGIKELCKVCSDAFFEHNKGNEITFFMI